VFSNINITFYNLDTTIFFT